MTRNTRERLRDVGWLVIRLGIGLSYIVLHGWFKLAGGPEYWVGLGENVRTFGITRFYVFFGLMSALAETLFALFFAAGLIFRVASAILFVNMVVATISHLAGGEGWQAAAHALHMGTLFLGGVLIGPGRYSLDARIRGKNRFTA